MTNVMDLRTAGKRTLGAAVVTTESTLNVITNSAQALNALASTARIKAEDVEYNARIESTFRRQTLHLEAMSKAAIKHTRVMQNIREEISSSPEMQEDYNNLIEQFSKLDINKI